MPVACPFHPLPGESVIIDGRSENSPFRVTETAGIYANHSAQPNAALEYRCVTVCNGV